MILALAAAATLTAVGAGRAQAPDATRLAQAAAPLAETSAETWAGPAGRLRIDDPDRRWLEAKRLRRVGGAAAAAADPRMIREYRDMDRRQRLMVIAALSAALIAMVGGLLMWRERQLRRHARPAAAAAASEPPLEPVRALINDLGRAIRTEAESRAAPEPKRDAPQPLTLEAALEAAAGATLRPCPNAAAEPRRAAPARAGAAETAKSLDAYFNELQSLKRSRPRPTPPREDLAPVEPRRGEDRRTDERPKTPAPGAPASAERARVWPSPSVSAWPLARRRAHAARMAERLGRRQPEPSAPRAAEPLSPTGQGQPPEDRVENILYRVRALGRIASEERRRRENAGRRAARPEQG